MSSSTAAAPCALAPAHALPCSAVLAPRMAHTSGEHHLRAQMMHAVSCHVVRNRGSIKANENVLRIIRSEWPWDMCQNLAWELCALRGKLPGQGGRRVHFATAPKDLDVDVWDHPTDWPCGVGGCGKSQFAASAVFFAEVCLMRKLCRNGNIIFTLGVGEIFECDVSEDALHDLVRSLQASR
jgi:hypothetical protein